MAERIRWDIDEKEKLINLVATMRMSDPETPMLALVKLAQEQLPPDRRRNLASTQSVPWLVEGVRRKFSNLNRDAARVKDAKARVVAMQEKLHKVENQEPVKIGPSHQELAKIKSTAKASALQSLQVNEMIGELFNRYNRENITKIKQLEDKMLSIERQLSKGPIEKRKPTYVIIGLLPNQQSEIDRHFKRQANFKFAEGKDENKKIPSGDRVFVATRFSGHKFTDEAYKTYDRNKVHLIQGGVSNLRNVITDCLNKDV